MEKEKNVDKIQQNIAKSHIPYNPKNLSDPTYRKQLLEGIDKKYAEESLTLFDEVFKGSMSSQEQIRFNQNAYRRGTKYDEAILAHNQQLVDRGGGTALQDIINSESRERLEYQLQHSPQYQMSNEENANSVTRLNRLKARNALLEQIEALGPATVQATASSQGGASNAGSFSSGGTGGGSSLGRINDIYKLLSLGIYVFPKQVKGTPPHLKQIQDEFKQQDQALKEREELASLSKEEEITENLRAQKEIEQNQRYLQYMTFGDYWGSITGSKGLSKNNYYIN